MKKPGFYEKNWVFFFETYGINADTETCSDYNKL